MSDSDLLKRGDVERALGTNLRDLDDVAAGAWAISRVRDIPAVPSPGVAEAVRLAVEYGGIDGDHHKAWVIDQMVRALTGAKYEEVVREAKAGKDGPDTYEWDEGVAP